ncbi:MAG: murein hydrolase activator EnvC family protein, partial [Steroidobacteraceae bacterium]
MHFGTPRRPLLRPRACALSVALLLLAGPVAGAPERPQADARKAEAELQAVKSEIERVTRQVSAEQVERDRLTRDLRSAELSVGRARETLAEVRRQRAEHARRRAALAAEQRERQAQLDKNRAELAGQMRAAYLIGRQEPLKLLLNQQDPALAGRMFAYYGYFGRARAGQIKLIEDDVQRIAELGSELDAEDAQLALLEQQQRAQLVQLEHSRAQRSHV